MYYRASQNNAPNIYRYKSDEEEIRTWNGTKRTGARWTPARYLETGNLDQADPGVPSLV